MPLVPHCVGTHHAVKGSDDGLKRAVFHYFKMATHENIRFSLLAVVLWDVYNHLGSITVVRSGLVSCILPDKIVTADRNITETHNHDLRPLKSATNVALEC